MPTNSTTNATVTLFSRAYNTTSRLGESPEGRGRELIPASKQYTTTALRTDALGRLPNFTRTQLGQEHAEARAGTCTLISTTKLDQPTVLGDDSRGHPQP